MGRSGIRDLNTRVGRECSISRGGPDCTVEVYMSEESEERVTVLRQRGCSKSESYQELLIDDMIHCKKIIKVFQALKNIDVLSFNLKNQSRKIRPGTSIEHQRIFFNYQFCPTFFFSLAVWAPNSGESGSYILVEILQINDYLTLRRCLFSNTALRARGLAFIKFVLTRSE